MKETLLPDTKKFNQSINGKQARLFVLKNKDLEAAVTNYGARLVSLLAPDKNGNKKDVTVGFNNLDQYFEAKGAYYGATVGRYANRIAFGKFSLNGTEYTLATNLGRHHLHGGVESFQDVVWDAEQTDEATVVFRYLSKDGEEGYPGNLQVTVTFQLTTQNELRLRFEAETDKPTVVNLTNHAYFNLNGQGSGSILNHVLEINADNYTPADNESIPLGTIETVKGSPFDFRKPMAIGSRIEEDNEQLKNGSGYDHNYVLNKTSQDEFSFAARAQGDQSGITMEVWTTEPGMQLYTGNFMPGKNQLPGGTIDEKNTAFCLETQHYPDSPNQSGFPSTVLNPGDKFDSETVFRFV